MLSKIRGICYNKITKKQLLQIEVRSILNEKI